MCAAADITLDPGEGVQPIASGITQVNGCNAISVTCTAPAGMTGVFMNFDNGMNNPDINAENPVVAMFTCNANGRWEYRSNIAMTSYMIQQISCFSF
uniref:C6 domain-containing protein n=1 Tax=Panagrolaimus sp. PS1159 TaxID=55785 RepID=A0AC35FM50_9BILA